MNSKDKYGTCELCGLKATLQDSHFIPKSIYRRMNIIKTEKTPIYLKNKDNDIIKLSNQITKYKLCSNCEGLLSQNGENYFLNNALYERKLITENEFNKIPNEDRRYSSYSEYIENNIPKLIRKFIKHIGYNTDEKYCYYKNDLSLQLSEEEISSLLYFAISIFWRGNLEWAQYKSYKLDASVIEEMKNYLLGKIDKIQNFTIKMDLAYPNYKIEGVLFPMPINKNIYAFVICDFIFTLEILPNSSIQQNLLFGFNVEIAKFYFDLFNKQWEYSNKVSGVPEKLNHMT